MTPVLDITAAAMEQLLRFRDQNADPQARCLYVRVSGAHSGEYEHALSIESTDRLSPDDVHERAGDLQVVIAQASAERLRGATIDWREQDGHTGFAVNNPNRPTADDALSARVLEVLEHEINPGIALHGGHAELVAVEGRTVYVRLSGGCQGCGMAAATLAQGIEATLTERVPEIVDVVDVTDHAAGTNPYYAPAAS